MRRAATVPARSRRPARRTRAARAPSARSSTRRRARADREPDSVGRAGGRS